MYVLLGIAQSFIVKYQVGFDFTDTMSYGLHSLPSIVLNFHPMHYYYWSLNCYVTHYTLCVFLHLLISDEGKRVPDPGGTVSII